MAAYEDTLDVPAKTWLEITSGIVVSGRVQNLGVAPLHVKRAAAPPTDVAGAISLPSMQVIPNVPLDDWWPGASGGKLYVYSDISGKVSVSHA